MKECRKILSRLHMLAEGELDPGVSEEMLTHIADCPDCSAKYDEFVEMKALIERTVDAKLTAPDVTQAVLEGTSEPWRRRGRIFLAFKWAGISFATAAMLLVIAAGAFLYHLGFIGPKPVAARQMRVSIDGGEWNRAEKSIRGSTVVSTDPGERLSLKLENDVLVVLNEKTSVEVQNVNKLRLLTGDIYVDTAERKGVLLRIETTDASTLVTGTKLGVSAEENATSVVVEEGKVTVDSSWGPQVVVYGNIFRIIQGMKPEPPEPVDVEEIFFWVKERARLTGMMIDAYNREAEESAADDGNAALLDEILYGLDQSREAIQTADVVFDVTTFDYGKGYDLTDLERKDYIENLVAGHIAQLDLKEPPSEERLREIIQEVVDTSRAQSKVRLEDKTFHWMFRRPDRLRLDILCCDASDFATALLMSRGKRYLRSTGPLAYDAARASEHEYHPAYFGRYPNAVEDLHNPRLLRTEDLDGVTTYVLAADVGEYDPVSGTPSAIVQLWVDPARGYVVPKRRKYIGGFTEHEAGECHEMLAESFEQVAPGIFYPTVCIRNDYPPDIIFNERVMVKERETVYTLREGEVNRQVPGRLFDTSTLPRASWNELSEENPYTKPVAESSLTPEELLAGTYKELERIKLYDDPTTPGSRKLVLSVNGKELENALRYKGGILFNGAYYNGECVGTRIIKVDPAIAAIVPFLSGDIIYTLNDKPWKVRGWMDWVGGLESCIPVANAGRPITAGIKRGGRLQYMILWTD